MAEPRIVSAVGVASGSGLSGKKSGRAAQIEAAIAAEIQKCFDEGLANDQKTIRSRMMKARRDTAARIDKDEAVEAARVAVEKAEEGAELARKNYDAQLSRDVGE